MDQKVKEYLGAFIVGGAIGVLGQFIMNLYVGWRLPHAVPLMVSTLALIGGVLAVTGVYRKIAGFGGMGANTPMCGLAAGIAEATAEAYCGGASPVRAVLAGLRAPAIIFGSGALMGLACLIAVRLF